MNGQKITLAELEPGARGQVLAVDLPGALGRRLEGLGLIPGTEIRCRMEGSGLTAFELRGTVLALRRRDAERIQVSQ